jgi:hypothetical protein
MSSRARNLPIWTPIMTRALSILAACSSPVFAAAAIAGWLFEIWPATPVTLFVSAFVVMGGPMLGIVHVITAKRAEDEEEPQEEAVTEVIAPPAATYRPTPIRVVREPAVLTPRSAAAARFAAWRDAPNEALAQRERERRASRYIRS